MSIEKTNTLQAGPEGDAAVERLLGLDEQRKGRCAVCGWPLRERIEDGCTAGSCSMRPPPARRYDEPAKYTTDIATAWRVLQAMFDRGWLLQVLTCRDGFVVNARRYELCELTGWHGSKLTNDFVQVEADTAPLAICRAAMATKSNTTNPESENP